MRRSLTLSALLIFLGLWVVYCGLGQFLAARFGFLTLDNVVISARAILATRGDALTLLSLGVPYPPLPFLLSLPFAALGLMNPAIWMSSLLGAGICAWFFVWFRADVARTPILVVLLLALPVLPGLLHGACLGTSGIAALALLVFSIHLATRFALEQQSLNELRSDGRLSAWIDTARDQAHAIRFLWAAALLLGLACCAQPSLILALPAFLLATPLLLPRSERRQGRRIFTIALLLYLPVVAVHVAGGTLSAMFDHDFFRGFRPAASSLHPEFLLPSFLTPAQTAAQLLLGFAVTCPSFFYLLLRLRNPAVAVLCLIPLLIAWIETAFAGIPLHRASFTLATLLAIVLIFLGARLRRFRRGELAALVTATMLSVIGSWFYFAASPQTTERALVQLATGRAESLTTFADERRLAANLTGARRVLLDERSGGAFITLLNDPRPFVLSRDGRNRFVLDNPQLGATHLLMRESPGSADAIATKWPSFSREKAAAFQEIAQAGLWRLFAHLHPETTP